MGLNVQNVLQDFVGGIMCVSVCGENFLTNLDKSKHQISMGFEKQLGCIFLSADYMTEDPNDDDRTTKCLKGEND